MSTEPKYPKYATATAQGFNTAPDGFYLLPAGEKLQPGDLSRNYAKEWVVLGAELVYGHISALWAWTYARRLPEGQANDDLPAPVTSAAKWAWGTDEEHFQGECDSAETAFIEGAAESDIEDDQTLYVGQIESPDPVFGITADRVLEWVEEYLSEDAPDSIGEILPSPSAVQKAALEEAMRKTYEAWLAAYPDQKPRWFRIKGKVLEKTGAEIRELHKP